MIYVYDSHDWFIFENNPNLLRLPQCQLSQATSFPREASLRRGWQVFLKITLSRWGRGYWAIPPDADLLYLLCQFLNYIFLQKIKYVVPNCM